MRRLLLLFVLALPAASPQKNSASDCAIDSTDLGYRIGSIEAKIDGRGKMLDRLKAALKTTDDNLLTLTVAAKDTKASLATFDVFGLIILITVIGNLVICLCTKKNANQPEAIQP